MMLVTYCRELWRRRTNEPEYILVFMFALENLLLLFIENVEFPFYYIQLVLSVSSDGGFS